MENEFITIAEAAKLLGETDETIMRRIKDSLEQEGLALETVMKRQQTPKGFMYVISKAFLLGEPTKSPFPSSLAKTDAKTDSLLLEAKDDLIGTLEQIITTKDKQIEDLSGKIDQLIERDRETNILLKTLQDKLFLLSAKGENKK